MSSYESAYPSLLQGVSQQITRLRLPGQLTAQENMLSDPVTGLRRRPGAKLIRSTESTAAAERLRVFYTEIGTSEVQGVIDTVTGQIRLYATDGGYAPIYDTASAYLVAPAGNDIQLATVGEELYICNVTKVPAVSGTVPGLDPATRGYAYIRAGAFSKLFELVVTTNLGTVTASFLTPSGSGAGDAALATPDNIALELFNDIFAVAGSLGISIARSGVYLYISATTATSVVTASSSGTAYMEVSGSNVVRAETQLPARLVAAADGYVIAVGESKAYRYYKYQHATLTWLEAGAYGSPASLVNMPLSLSYDGVSFIMSDTGWEGRLAGDDDTNAPPPFITNARVTGMAAYQGRLVLMSGPDVSLSASGKAKRFWRSTVLTLNDDDVIHIRGSSGTAAAYVQAVPFQKDLVLFSSSHQALIPSSGQALTPRNATIVLTSQYACDTGARPVPIGRTMLYPMARSASYFGIMEMMQSPYTDSQYTSSDSTVHLPKYMPGRCRGGVSSTSANMVLFTSTGDLRSVTVYEYNWSGDEKIQQAWHRWTLPYDVAGAYFVKDKIVMVLIGPQGFMHVELDVRAGLLDSDTQRLPLLDCWSYGVVAAGVVATPAVLLDADATATVKVEMVATTGGLAGERVGFTATGDVLSTAISFQDGQVAIGIPYTSLFSPTPVQLMDYQGNKIDSAKATVLRYGINMRNSGPFEITVGDAYGGYDQSLSTLYYSSYDLQPGQSQLAQDSRITLPARINPITGNFVMWQDGPWEMNVVAVDYIVRYNQKIKRR